MSKEGLTKERLEILLILYKILLSALKRERAYCIRRNRPLPSHPDTMMMAAKLLEEIKEDDEPEVDKFFKERTKKAAQKLYDFLKTNDSINKDNS